MRGKWNTTAWMAVIALAVGVTLWSCGGGGGHDRRPPPAPAIANITPDTGSTFGGETVTIDTTGFSEDFQATPPATVTFDGANGTNITGIGTDTFTVMTPPGAPGPADVVVTAQNAQTATSVGGYTYVTPANCNILSVTPTQGSDSGGNSVTITGTSFEWSDPALAVTFGGVPATSVTGIDAGTISCVTPQCLGCGTVDVRVTSTNTDCTLVGGFDYLSAPTCQVNTVTPGNGPLTGGTPVTIGGSGFTGATQVTFGGVPGTGLNVPSDTQITVTTPADPLGIPLGDYDVNVVVITPSTSCSLLAGFHYDPGVIPCTISTILPPNGSSGGGDAVQILGSGFSPVGANPTVTIGGSSAMILAASDIQIDLLTPTGAPGPADVVITNSTGGTCSRLGGFTYDPVNPACNITNVSPNSGDAQGGEQVTINGSNFDALSNQVLFGGNPVLSIVSQNANQIVVITPPGSAGSVDVEVFPQNGPACIDVGGFTYTGCGVFDVTPNSGPLSGTNAVTVSGTGFDPTDVQVWFGANQATLLNPPVPTPTSLVVLVPAGASLGLVDVTVINPTLGTQCTLVGGYTYAGCVIGSLTPNSGPKMGGTRFTIFGSNLADGGGAVVLVGGNVATNVDIAGAPNSIACDSPPSLVDGPVEVEVINTSGTNCLRPNGFSYDPAAGTNCTISSLNPPNGDLGGGTNVTITGSNFDVSGVGVLFGPNPATVNNVTASTIDVTSPPGAVLGPVDVHVVNANGGTCTGGPFTYDPPAGCNLFCTPTGISPDPIPFGAGGIATITGQCDPDPAVLIGFCPNDVTITVWQNGTPSAPFAPTSGACDSLTVQIPPSPVGAPGPATVVLQQLANTCIQMFTYN